MTNDLTAEEVRALLKLEPHATCGFRRVTFLSKQRIAPGGLPVADGSASVPALCFVAVLVPSIEPFARRLTQTPLHGLTANGSDPR